MLIPTFKVYGQSEGYTPSGIPFLELESQIYAIVSEHLGQTAPGAAVVIVHNGEIIFSQGYGYADIERSIPIDPANTVFSYASISKLLVWTSAMQLVEQELLDLDADISIYLPDDFIQQINLEFPITMRHLMNHSAGFEGTALDLARSAHTVETHSDLRDALLLTRPRQIFEPNTASSYSNWGAALAAYVVGHIAGQRYIEFERDNIKLPAGMTNTLTQPDWIHNHGFLNSKALAYIPNGQGGFIETDWLYFSIYPTGTLAGTAEDLARFAIALTPQDGESGVLFEHPESLSKIFTPSSLNPTEPGTHHGFWHYRGKYAAFGHAGQSHHFSNFAIVPEHRFGFVVFANATGESQIIPAVSELLLGNIQTPLPQNNSPDTSLFEGQYLMMQLYFESNFLSLITGITPRDIVTAIDENVIELNTAMFGAARYMQTEPYFFQVISTDNPAMTLFFPTLRFQMENGQPSRILVGDGKDFMHLPASAMLDVSLLGIVFSILLFLIFPVILLISYLLNRKKGFVSTRFHLLSNCFLMTGTLLLLNNLIFIVRVLISMESAIVNTHILLNYIFSGVSILLFISSLFYLRAGEIRKRRKVLFGLTAFCTALLIFILIYWNLFVFL
ncbi:MAG: beta-lactamase family protein [Defluviitaleaceae bacterium]|nr:beta-lactamase family protein [Defluviitaleaceae bacterium]